MDEPTVERTLSLARHLEAWSQRLNLTGHRTLEAIVVRLILDAAALSRHLPQVENVCDLGSGAGFPGLPLALLRPDSRVTLVEARQRRHHFQRAAVRRLKLANAFPLCGRIEELPAIPHEAVVAQAVAPPERVAAWMVRWAAPGGLLLLPTGPEPPRIPDSADLERTEWRTYRVPCGGPTRGLWVARRR